MSGSTGPREAPALGTTHSWVKTHTQLDTHIHTYEVIDPCLCAFIYVFSRVKPVQTVSGGNSGYGAGQCGGGPSPLLVGEEFLLLQPGCDPGVVGEVVLGARPLEHTDLGENFKLLQRRRESRRERRREREGGFERYTERERKNDRLRQQGQKS